MRLIRRVCMEWIRLPLGANGRKLSMNGRKRKVIGRKPSFSGRKLIS
jgi:hypothetical protein